MSPLTCSLLALAALLAIATARSDGDNCITRDLGYNGQPANPVFVDVDESIETTYQLDVPSSACPYPGKHVCGAQVTSCNKGGHANVDSRIDGDFYGLLNTITLTCSWSRTCLDGAFVTYIPKCCFPTANQK